MKRILPFLFLLWGWPLLASPTPILTLVIPTGGGANPSGTEEIQTGATLTLDAGATAIFNNLTPSTLLYLNASNQMSSVTLGSGLTLTSGTLTASSSGAAVWGDITGTLSSQTDLQSALNGKLSLSGGTLTGNLILGGNHISIGGGDSAIWVDSNAAYNSDAATHTAMLQGPDGNFGFASDGTELYFNGHNFVDNSGDLLGSGSLLSGVVTSLNTLTGSLTLATTSTGTTNSVTPSGSTITLNIGTSTFATTAGSAPPTGSAGGDLSGTFPNPTLNLALSHTWTGTQTMPQLNLGNSSLVGNVITGTAGLPAGSGTLLYTNGGFSGLLTGATGSASGTWTGTFTGISSGTFTGPLIGNASTATTAGSTGSYTGATVGTGTALVVGLTDSYGDLILGTTASGSSIVFNPNYSVQAPNLITPLGPSSGNVIYYGDSLTSGVGATAIVDLLFPYAGPVGSMPDNFATSPMGTSLQHFNLGISGQTTAQGLSQYGAGTGTTTVTTNSTTTVTVTGSTSGMSGTMAVYMSNGDIPYITTATISGTTLTLSRAATGSHSGATLYFATAEGGYGQNNFFASAHILSDAVTGNPTWFFNRYGTNDYYVGGITATGTAATSRGTVTSVSITTGSSVGSASLATAVTGTYNAWGGTGTGQGSDFTSLGTIVSQSGGTSFVVSNPSAVLNTMTTFKLTPQITTWQSTYSGLTNDAVADGDRVMVCTLFPFVVGTAGYNQGQYDEVRLQYNAWLTATYFPNGTVASVTFCDSANNPQLQYLLPNGSTNPNYSLYRSAGVPPHLNPLGYALDATFLAKVFSVNYTSSLQGLENFMVRGGITPGMLPVTTPNTAIANTFTASQTVGTLANNGTQNLTISGNLNLNSSFSNGNSSPSVSISGANQSFFSMFAGSTKVLSLNGVNSTSAAIFGPSGSGGMTFTSGIMVEADTETYTGNGGLFALGSNNTTSYPGFLIYHAGEGTNQNNWSVQVNASNQLGFFAVNDPNSAANGAILVNRGSGYTISNVTIPSSGLIVSGGLITGSAGISDTGTLSNTGPISETGTSTLTGPLTVTGTTTLASGLTGIGYLSSGVVSAAVVGSGLNYTTGTLTATGLSNPMTTLGDLIYENATPAVARLAGNTSATLKFLSQTGTGSASAAPVWSAIPNPPSGNSATPTVVYGTGANTPTGTSIVGNGESGVITFTTGATPATAGTVLTATFGSSFAYPTGCTCVVFPGNASSALLSGTSMLYSTGSTTTFVLTSGSVALSGLTTYVIAYQIKGY